MTSDAGRPAVFFDRDGTLMEDVDYCGNPADVRVFPGAPAALRRLKDAGFRLVIITNQSGIGRGYFTEETYRSVDAELRRQIGSDLIDASYHCSHLPDDGCACRKPSPQMLFDAAREHRLDLAHSFFVGDKLSDVECGRAAGVRTVLVKTGYGNSVDESRPDLVAPDLQHAADLILKAHETTPSCRTK
ncbi:MAG: D-glycero-alpha-D-manno-heptose-1,7-bisphosphate 7-phosphatase [Chthoniobacterales bacterium]